MSGVPWRLRAAMEQDRVSISKFVPIHDGHTTTLRVVDDLDRYATRQKHQTAHDAVVPDAELG